HADKGAQRCLGVVRRDEEQVQRRAPLGGRDRDLAQRRLAAEGLAVFVFHFPRQRQRDARQRAIHVMLEQRQQLGAALLLPVLRGRDPRAIAHRERVRHFFGRGELVGLGPIGRGGGAHRNGSRQK